MSSFATFHANKQGLCKQSPQKGTVMQAVAAERAHRSPAEVASAAAAW